MNFRPPRLLVLALVFFAGGSTLSIIGASLPSLARSIGESEASTSLLATWFSGGAAVSALAMVYAGRRVSLERLLAPLLGLEALALGAIALADELPLLFVLAAAAGAGFVGGECVVIALTNRRRDAARSHGILNTLFALGAVSMPVVVAFTVRASATPALAFMVAAALAGTAALASLGLRPTKSTPGTPRFRSGYSRLAILIALYVGAEAVMATWVAALAERQQLITEGWSALSSSIFWGALLVGRLVGTLLVGRVQARRLLIWALVTSAMFVTAAAGLVQVNAAVAAIALVGGVVAAGPVFQLVVTEMGETQGLAAVATLLVLGSLGSIVATAVAAWASGLGVVAVLLVPVILLFAGIGLTTTGGKQAADSV